jgi:outer membrane protein assembly factor BamB
MRSYPCLRRWLAAATVFGVCALAVFFGRPRHEAGSAPAPTSLTPGSQSWPLFGGTAGRNLVNTLDRDLPSTWGTEGGKPTNIKWVAQLGDRSYGSAVVAGGKIFLGTNNRHPRNRRDTDPKTGDPVDRGILMCLRESDGQFLWQAVHDKLPAGRVNDWPDEGILSMPVVEGNRLYYVSNRAEVVCADTEGFLDGKNDGAQDEKYQDKTDADFLWRYDMIKELNVFPHNLAICSPLIVGDLLLVVTANGVDEGHTNIPHPEAPSFLCLNKKDGTLRWQSNLPTAALAGARARGRPGNAWELSRRGAVLMHGQWSNPAYAEVRGKGQVIFPGGNGWLYAFEPRTGKLLWKFDCNPKDSLYDPGGRGTRSDFVATPVAHEGKLYIGTGQDPEHQEGVGHLWCLDLARATEKGATNRDHDVSPRDDNFDPRAEVNKDSALHWHFGGPKKGGGRYPYVFGRTLSTCAVQGGLCYAAELGGRLYCLDAGTGREYWEHDMQAACWSSPYWVDNKVYLGNDFGEVFIFRHGKDKRLLNTVEMEGGVRGAPVAVNGVLYITSEGKLYAIARN